MFRYDVEFEKLRSTSIQEPQGQLQALTIAAPVLPLDSAVTAPNSLRTSKKLGMTMQDLTDFYLMKLKLAGNKKTIQDFTSSISVALEFFLPNTLASQVSRDDARSFMMFVSKLPVRFALAKETRNRPLKDVISIADRLGLVRSSVPTTNKRIDVIRAVFAYGLEEEKITNNPFLNLSMKDPKKAKGKRNPMSATDIGKLFKGLKGGSEDFWVTMIALYQGARQNEILQLQYEDVFFESGVWLMSFHDRHESNRLKTESSVRVVPLHNELVSLGFIKWCKDGLPRNRLFPSATLGVYGNYSQTYSKHINAEYGRIGVSNHFHSLRHSFRDACREAEISSDIADYLGGWSGAASVSRSYGSLEFSLKHLSAALNKIQYTV